VRPLSLSLSLIVCYFYASCKTMRSETLRIRSGQYKRSAMRCDADAERARPSNQTARQAAAIFLLPSFVFSFSSLFFLFENISRIRSIVRLIATVNSAFIGRTADFFVVRDRLNAIGKHQCSPSQPWCGLVSSSPTFSAVAFQPGD